MKSSYFTMKVPVSRLLRAVLPTSLPLIRIEFDIEGTPGLLYASRPVDGDWTIMLDSKPVKVDSSILRALIPSYLSIKIFESEKSSASMNIEKVKDTASSEIYWRVEATFPTSEVLRECMGEILLCLPPVEAFSDNGRQASKSRTFEGAGDELRRIANELSRMIGNASDNYLRVQEDARKEILASKALSNELIERARQEIEVERSKLVEREEMLKEKEASLSSREEELVHKTADQHRREIGKKHVEELSGDLKDLITLSPSTEAARKTFNIRLVSAIAACFLVLILNLVIFMCFPEWASSTKAWALIVSKATLTVALLWLVGYWIKWNRDWSSAQARREAAFRNAKIDVLRAHWTVELIFEFRNAGVDPKISESILPVLTKHLFESTHGDAGQDPASIADSLSRILGRGDLELNYKNSGLRLGGKKLIEKEKETE